MVKIKRSCIHLYLLSLFHQIPFIHKNLPFFPFFSKLLFSLLMKYVDLDIPSRFF